ncbi:hypothetical protein HC024_21770 [Methylococcaceae bacterium WWC4]|nr:hypothetical protein [Methylococcaceae bacterium WWC4]
MSIRNVTIIVDRQERNITPGLKQGFDLIQSFKLDTNQNLLLEIHGDIDVPVSSEDFLLITGGEVFSVGDSNVQIEDNPPLRKPIRCTLNEQQLSEHQALCHAKITGKELKNLDPHAKPGSRLVADLDGLADEVIGDHQRIIVKPHDQFIVMPPSEDHTHQHEITVAIDDRHVALATGSYLVSVMKQKLGIPFEYELERVEHGQFYPLADDSIFELRKHEHFISHVRTGSSS